MREAAAQGGGDGGDGPPSTGALCNFPAVPAALLLPRTCAPHKPP